MRYYFDIHDGAEHHDEIGRDLESAQMRVEALRVVAGLLEAEAGDAKDTTLVLSVRDEFGATPLKVRMACQIEEQWRQTAGVREATYLIERGPENYCFDRAGP